MTRREAYIHSRRPLFWSVAADKLNSVSDELLVETILNYGSMEDVRELFKLLSLERTAAVFFKTTEGRVRHNYFPEVANYFQIYFNRHVRQHTV